MSMHGKVVVVTGSNVGIGLETAVGVAALEATTVLACRNRAKAEAAATEVTQRTWNDDVHVVPLDLADLASVKEAAENILSRWDRLDVLVNNAGGTWSERRLTAQGFEYTFGVNHLGHFSLTNQLLPRLRAVAPSRIVNVTSVGPPRRLARHALRRSAEREGLRRDGGLLPLQVGQRPLHPSAGDCGSRAPASRRTPCTPGPVRSGFGMDGDLSGFMGFGMRLVRPFEISPRRGAKTSIFLATSPDVATKTGMYWVRSKPGHMSRQARDDEAAARLWDESEKLLASAGFSML